MTLRPTALNWRINPLGTLSRPPRTDYAEAGTP